MHLDSQSLRLMAWILLEIVSLTGTPHKYRKFWCRAGKKNLLCEIEKVFHMGDSNQGESRQSSEPQDPGLCAASETVKTLCLSSSNECTMHQFSCIPFSYGSSMTFSMPIPWLETQLSPETLVWSTCGSWNLTSNLYWNVRCTTLPSRWFPWLSYVSMKNQQDLSCYG